MERQELPSCSSGNSSSKGLCPLLSSCTWWWQLVGSGSHRTLSPVYLLRPQSYTFAQPSIPVPPVGRPAAGFLEGHPRALPHSSHGSAAPLSVPGMWTHPPAPVGTCVATSWVAVDPQLQSWPRAHPHMNPNHIWEIKDYILQATECNFGSSMKTGLVQH